MDAQPAKPTVPSQPGDVSSPSSTIAGSAQATENSSAAHPPTAASAAKLRKRTKTGCLTCRKRRIKCGEERPICNNCIKSKRQCEGYNPRVIWKPPIGDWPGHHSIASTLPYHTGVIPGARPAYPPQQQPQQQQQPRPPVLHQRTGPNTPIQPRPIVGQPFDFANITSSQIPLMGQPQSPAVPVPPHTGYQYVDHGTPAGYVDAAGMHPGVQNAAPHVPFQSEHHPEHPGYLYDPESYRSPHPDYHQPQNFQQSMMVSPSVGPELSPQDPQPSFAQPMSPQEQQHLHHPFRHQSEALYTPVVSPNHSSFPHQSQQVSPQEEFVPASNNPPQTESLHLRYPPLYAHGTMDFQGPGSAKDGPVPMRPQEGPKPFPNIDSGYQTLPDNKFDPEQVVAEQFPTQSPVDTRALEAQLMTSQYVSDQATPTDMLYEAAVEACDDDYYDVHSDEDEDEDIGPDELILRNPKQQQDLGLMMRLFHQHTDELRIRRIDAFVFDGILDRYHAEWSANPLKNEKTARVFAHFIYATGPMLSIHERNPLNTTAMFSQVPVPHSQQGLWTYTLPTMALHNQGLLHAMLALGSLHIARLQRASITPSLKHYAYALKRIHKSVGIPSKRYQVSTLAATLLLGFYELMTADHVKWCAHLIGARQLIVELDYGSLTSTAKKMKTEQADYDRNLRFFDPHLAIPQRPHQGVFKSAYEMPDERILSTLIGRKLHYDERGRVVEDFNQQQPSAAPPAIDMSKYEVFQDLYWWYCRQDAYQSIVSGNPLHMDYSRWGDCPPRAPIGRPDAIFATQDHFLLLIGRVADFVTKDRARKVKVMEANDRQWRPSPLFMNLMKSAKGHPQGQPSVPVRKPSSTHEARLSHSEGSKGPSSVASPPQIPPFYGMAPSAGGKAYMPASYARSRQETPEYAESLPLDLEAATHSALEEWTQLNAAVEVFASSLGPAFQPLSAEYHQPLSTPFGDARQYRSYEISIIWALYYMAKIITIRSHPSMPPAAMMAATVAAPLTAELANEIGRITAGVALPPSNMQLNPSLGAALISSTMPLFFAGVQYTEPEQRSWLVPRLLEIEARTGFGSAGLIAGGCETAWERMAESGRGPPYKRMRREPDIGMVLSGRVEPPTEDEVVQHGTHGDRRFVLGVGRRAHWAMGLLAEGKDLSSMT